MVASDLSRSRRDTEGRLKKLVHVHGLRDRVVDEARVHHGPQTASTRPPNANSPRARMADRDLDHELLPPPVGKVDVDDDDVEVDPGQQLPGLLHTPGRDDIGESAAFDEALHGGHQPRVHRHHQHRPLAAGHGLNMRPALVGS